ncbi:hypothetical protein C2S52_022161 [Perilla frutescens var. hirtella]|nr:hypothetical protein C2S52_022161 [Perilla frutescens var. hirtella]
MDHKHFMLHELLQQDQEPFHLKTYISDKRSQLHNSSPATALQLKRAPYLSPCRSPCGGAFLRVPSRTAAVLAEAAMKIQKQRRLKPITQTKSVRLCLFGSFFKVLMKNRSKNRVLRNCDLKEKENSEEIRISCSCNRLSRDDLRASSSTYRPELFHEIGGFELREARFCSSPFRFCIHKSPSSPATSPTRCVKQEKENSALGLELHNVSGVEEEKEQCSPVSVLDTFFEDDAHESVVEEDDDDDDDLERSYANIERARQQLLDRLRRFEKLAALDPVDLEQKLLEASDEEYYQNGVESEGDIKRCSDKKRVVCDHHHVKCKVVFLGNLLPAAEFSDIDAVVKAELDEWRRSAAEEEEETAAQVEVAIFGGLMEELSDDLFCMEDQQLYV